MQGKPAPLIILTVIEIFCQFLILSVLTIPHTHEYGFITQERERRRLTHLPPSHLAALFLLLKDFLQNSLHNTVPASGLDLSLYSSPSHPFSVNHPLVPPSFPTHHHSF